MEAVRRILKSRRLTKTDGRQFILAAVIVYELYPGFFAGNRIRNRGWDHVVYTALDAESPASTSHIVTREIIRGLCRFGGLLMSDDLSMKALAGPMRERATAVIAAGSDVALHCNGDMAEMELAADGVPALSGVASARFEHCINLLNRADAFDLAEAEATLVRLALLA